MKRLISFGLVAIMMFSLCGYVYANSNHVETEEVEKNLKVSDDIYELYAENLNKLGLFQGSNKGYELDKGLTRAEGATIILRLVADEKEVAKKPKAKHPFTDVPKWADKNIGYLYNKGMVQGISKDKFGSQNNMSAKDFTTFILRVLDYIDLKGDFTWEKSLDKAVEIGLYDNSYKNELESRDFLRKDAVYILGKSLKTSFKGINTPLINDIRWIDKKARKYASIFYGESTVSKEESGFEDDVVYYGGLNRDKMGVYDNKIYYIAENDPNYNKLYIYDTVSKKKTCSDNYVSNFIIDEDDIYMFINNKEDKGLYTAKLKDINNVKRISGLDDNKRYNILGIYKNEIYFYEMNAEDYDIGDLYGNVCKINLSNGKKEIVIDDKVFYFVNYMYESEIYYSTYDEREIDNSDCGLKVYNLDNNKVKTYLEDKWIIGVIANEKSILVNADNNIYLINRDNEKGNIIYKNTTGSFYGLYSGWLYFENNNSNDFVRYNIYNGNIERIEFDNMNVDYFVIYDDALYWILWNNDKYIAELYMSDLGIKKLIKCD